MAKAHNPAFSPIAHAMSAAQAPVDDRAVDAFFRAERADLVSFLRRRTATEEDAQDAAQESMARLLRYSGSEPPVVWKSLLYRIATNVALDQGRRAQRHHTAQHVSLEDEEPVSPAPAHEDALAREQMLARVRTAILGLPPKCRQVYLLSLEGWKQTQIATHCGISVKMVEKHVTKALAAIRRQAGETPGGALK